MLQLLLASLVLAASPDEPCTIRGQVDMDGVPATGAVVHAIREMDWVVLETRTATLDDKGRFAFTGLAEGWYRVSAFHVDAMPQSAGSWYCQGFGKAHEITLALRHGGELIEGSITDRDHLPLAGSWASVNNAGKPRTIDGSALIPVDAQGRFRVRLATGAAYNLYGTAPGHRFGSFSVSLREERREALGNADMKLMREPYIRGVVVDSKGRPVPKAEVFRGPFGASSPPHVVVTAADGTFLMPGLLDVDLVVSARSARLWGTERAGRLGEAADAEVRIVVGSGRSLRGTVSLPNGAVVPGGEVFVRTASGLFATSVADARGRFVCEGLPPGNLEVRALRGTFGGWKLVKEGVDDVEVTLTPPE